MSEGHLYIFVNKHMPGLVKIGYTERDPDVRAAELSTPTGVPGKFEVFISWLLDDPYVHEQRVFKQLNKHRHPGTEFFELPPAKAAEAAKAYLIKFGANDL